jgi:hypothetical protein
MRIGENVSYLYLYRHKLSTSTQELSIKIDSLCKTKNRSQIMKIILATHSLWSNKGAGRPAMIILARTIIHSRWKPT